MCAERSTLGFLLLFSESASPFHSQRVQIRRELKRGESQLQRCRPEIGKAGRDEVNVTGTVPAILKVGICGCFIRFFWIFISSGGMVKVVRASRKTVEEGKTA